MNVDFSGIASALATISLGLAGVVMAGGMLFPDAAQRYKKQIPDVIIGLILVSIAGYLIGSFGG